MGTDSASVRKARELMEIKQESHPISMEAFQYMKRRYDTRGELNNDVVGDLRETSGLLAIRLLAATPSILFIGTVSTLKSARMLLDICVSNMYSIYLYYFLSISIYIYIYIHMYLKYRWIM